MKPPSVSNVLEKPVWNTPSADRGTLHLDAYPEREFNPVVDPLTRPLEGQLSNVSNIERISSTDMTEATNPEPTSVSSSRSAD